MSHRYFMPLILCLSFFVKANAAYSDTIPKTNTLSRIKLTDNSYLSGYIVQADDSSITFIKKADWKKQMYMRRETLPAERIEGITKGFKNGMTAGRGLLYGGLGGTVLGFALGLSSDCEDSDGDGKCDFGEKLLATRNFTLSLLLGASFAVVGMIIGLFSKKKDKVYYNIGGKRENIRYNKIGLTF